MNNFEWRDGAVWFKCGKCYDFSVRQIRFFNFRERKRMVACTNRGCLAMGKSKDAVDWQGIEMEARNLMYT